MKKLTDRVVLIILALTAVLILCFCGIAMEYNLFGQSEVQPASVTVSIASNIPSSTVVPSTQSSSVAASSNLIPSSSVNVSTHSIASKGSTVSSALAKVNINTASEKELDSLPGVGEVIAKRIVEYRKEHGDFSSIEELLEVKGIGNAKLEKMRSYVIVE